MTINQEENKIKVTPLEFIGQYRQSRFGGPSIEIKSNDENEKISFGEMYEELVSKYGDRVQIKTCDRSIDSEKKAIYIPIISGDSISITPISTDMINICIGRTSAVCYCPSNNHTVKEMNRASLNEIIKLIDGADSITNNHTSIVNEDNYNLSELVVEEEPGEKVELKVEVVGTENK